MALHVMEEANRCLQCKKPRCQEGCPIHTNIPAVIRLLREGKLNDAGWMLFAQRDRYQARQSYDQAPS